MYFGNIYKFLTEGKLFVADLKNGKIISDDELKDDICARS